MLDSLDGLERKTTLVVILIAMAMIVVSGIVFAFAYFGISTFQTTLEGVSCDLPGTAFFTDCQDAFTQTIYKILELKSVLVWSSYIFIFLLILVILISAFRSGNKPSSIGLLVVGVFGFTYLGILASNMYRTLLENTVFYNIMQDFVIYNKIMLNLPWFIGFISIVGVALSIINYQKSQVNSLSQSDLNY